MKYIKLFESNEEEDYNLGYCYIITILYSLEDYIKLIGNGYKKINK